MWQDTHKTKEFPNVRGSSAASLGEIRAFMGGMPLEETYKYVPGLRRDDPGDLVLMYMSRPTRWKRHFGLAPTIFHAKAWILVPVDMKLYGSERVAGPGELSEHVSRDEFVQRLRKTLDFLRSNERPNWAAVVDEHTQWLQKTEKSEQ